MPRPVDPNWSPARALEAKRLVNRVRKAGGSKALQQVHLYPELGKLKAAGWTYADMAKYIGEAGGPRTKRRYMQIMHDVGQQVRPKGYGDDLDWDHQSMLEWNIEAFEKWFLRYSPHEYFPKHARSWVEAFLREKNLLLNVPPGHAKSEFFMIWIPVWLITRDRNVQILMVSNSAEDASTWAMEVAGQLEFNEALIHDYGRFAPENQGDQRWNASRGVFSVLGRNRKVKGAQFTMESRGMTGRVLGRRADFIIVDDPTKQEDAESPATRKTQLKHLQQQVFTRAEPEGEWKGGRVVVIGQRVHMLDLYGELEKQEWERGDRRGSKVWHQEKYPAVLDWENHQTLWPERFPWEEIELIYARVGGHVPFECMYQQNPLPEGNSIVTRAQVEACFDWDRKGGEGFKRSPDGFPPIVRVLSVDPSPTKFNGIVVGDLAWHKEQFSFAVMHVESIKAGVEQVKATCDHLIAQYRPDYFIFEESGFLAWFRNDPWFVELEKRVQFVRHHTGVNKNSMEFGVQSLAGDFEFQRISLPYGDEAGRRMTEILAREALQYPDGDTYDTIMALWFAKFHYKRMAPVRALSGHFRGSNGKGWSFLKKKEPDPWKEKILVG